MPKKEKEYGVTLYGYYVEYNDQEGNRKRLEHKGCASEKQAYAEMLLKATDLKNQKNEIVDEDTFKYTVE